MQGRESQFSDTGRSAEKSTLEVVANEGAMRNSS
jgi:hypothetical protein